MGAAMFQAPLRALRPGLAEVGLRVEMWSLGRGGRGSSFCSPGGKRGAGAARGVCCRLWRLSVSLRGGFSTPRVASSPLSALQRKSSQGKGTLGPGTPAHVCIIRRRETLVFFGMSHPQKRSSCASGGYTGNSLHMRNGAGEAWAVPRRQAQPGTGLTQGWGKAATLGSAWRGVHQPAHLLSQQRDPWLRPDSPAQLGASLVSSGLRRTRELGANGAPLTHEASRLWWPGQW